MIRNHRKRALPATLVRYLSEVNNVGKSANDVTSMPDPKGARRTLWWVRLLQEPLLHFFLLGIALFAATRLWGDANPEPEDNQIVVTAGKVSSLIQIFQRTFQRPPTRQELDGLIQDFVNEEVFYREALAMGLDQDDTVIRRRLRQKLEFVAEDLADAVEPSDEQLAAFLAENPDRFRLEDRTSFSQVYFSPQRRGDSLESDVQQTLEKLREAKSTIDLTLFGDPTLLPIEHDVLRQSEITNMMGPQFEQGLKQVPVGVWTGPIPSSYGWHLVQVQQRVPGRIPKLDEVRDIVRREWFARRREESKQQFYDSLRNRYEVVIEMPVLERPTGNELEEDVRDRDTTETP